MLRGLLDHSDVDTEAGGVMPIDDHRDKNKHSLRMRKDNSNRKASL